MGNPLQVLAEDLLQTPVSRRASACGARQKRSLTLGNPVQVLAEDLVLVKGQQERMLAGFDVWANPVSYDKLGVRYRRWRNSLASGSSAEQQEARSQLVQMAAGELFSLEQTP